jgi:hypothetical protein
MQKYAPKAAKIAQTALASSFLGEVVVMKTR